MRKFFVGVALVVALLGAIGLGSAHSLTTVHPLATQSHLLVDGTPTPYGPVCPGGGSTNCG